jgi:hypothetical protein
MVAVVSEGNVVEYADPQELINDKTSIFFKLIKKEF